MKKYFLLCKILFLNSPVFAQFTIASGTQWVNNGNVIVNINNLDMIKNGSFLPGTSSIKFTGNTANTINGGPGITFYQLEIGKTGNNKIVLSSNVDVNSKVNFISGLLDLNQQNLTLASTAVLNNENESSRIIGPNGGEVIITLALNAPAGIDAGNLGSAITSSVNLGIVTIKRGHKAQTGSGLNGSINRYFNIHPANNSNLDATLQFKYFTAELNGQDENTMVFFKSSDGGVSWTSQPVNSRDVAANYVAKSNINSFSLWTLSGPASSPLPVTGLEFFVHRIDPVRVNLDWKTIQEMNNLGFDIERKRETDNDFVSAGFINSKAFNGNSNSPLEYSRVDTNNFAGRTYYRLKQVDIDGKFIYSVTRVVTGSTQKQITLKAWPVPAIGNFNIIVQGIDKNETVLLYDVSGKLIQAVPVADNIPQTVNKLAAGTYLIKLSTDNNIIQKIIVQ